MLSTNWVDTKLVIHEHKGTKCVQIKYEIVNRNLKTIITIHLCTEKLSIHKYQVSWQLNNSLIEWLLATCKREQIAYKLSEKTRTITYSVIPEICWKFAEQRGYSRKIKWAMTARALKLTETKHLRFNYERG